MSAEHLGAEGGSRGAVVALTLIGLALIATVMFLAKAGDDTYGLIYATDQLGLTASLAAQTLLLKRIVFVLSLPAFGLLSDLVSRRVCLIIGAGIFGLAIMAKAVASAVPLYFAGEIGTALGMAIALPALFALALEASRPQQWLASAAGGVLLIGALSSHLAPIILVRVAVASGWHWSYGLMSGVVLLGSAIGGALLLTAGAMARRRPGPERSADDPRGWLWVLVVLGVLVTSLRKAGRRMSASSRRRRARPPRSCPTPWSPSRGSAGTTAARIRRSWRRWCAGPQAPGFAVTLGPLRGISNRR